MEERMQCYVRNMITDTTMSFTLLPDELTDNVSANYDTQEIRGRSSPLQGYNSTSARTVSYTLELHDDYCQSGLIATVNFLKGLVYPSYGGTITPPRSYLRFGDMVTMQCIVNDVSVTWQTPVRNGIYVRASVSLQFTEVTSSPASATQIQNGLGSYLKV